MAQAAIQHAGSALANVNVQALIAGSVSLLISVCTPAALSRFVPGSLLGLAAGTLLANMKGFSAPNLLCATSPISLRNSSAADREFVNELHEQMSMACTTFAGVPRLGTIPSGIPIPHVPSFPLGFLPAIIASAGLGPSCSCTMLVLNFHSLRLPP